MASVTTTNSHSTQRRKGINKNTKNRPTLADQVESTNQPSTKNTSPKTAQQQHISFFDQDNDGIIWPTDVYKGFRALGFSIPFSLGALLIPVFFSYPTRLGRSWIPDPFLRIYVDDIHKAKHGSDTGVYDFDGNFNADRFEHMFDRFDSSGVGGLGVGDLVELLRKDRCAADLAGWCFAFMEWWTTWVLLQEDGRVWKEDLRACYDGTLFWRISEERSRGGGWQKGYGISDFLHSVWYNGTWKSWEVMTKTN